MSDVNWEQIARNGQLVWDREPEHRVMLDRFYSFWKGTADEQVIASKYPAYYDLQTAREVKPEVKTVTETVVAEVTPKKKSKKPSSPSSDVSR